MNDPLAFCTMTAVVIATIAGGAVFVGLAFTAPGVPTSDPLERVVADLFRAVPAGTDWQGYVPPTSTGRMRALVADFARAKAADEGGGEPSGRHRQ